MSTQVDLERLARRAMEPGPTTAPVRLGDAVLTEVARTRRSTRRRWWQRDPMPPRTSTRLTIAGVAPVVLTLLLVVLGATAFVAGRWQDAQPDIVVVPSPSSVVSPGPSGVVAPPPLPAGDLWMQMSSYGTSGLTVFESQAGDQTGIKVCAFDSEAISTVLCSSDVAGYGWSPNGSALAIAIGRPASARPQADDAGVHVYEASSGTDRQLASCTVVRCAGRMDLTWTDDGRAIAVYTPDASPRELMVIDAADGSVLRRVDVPASARFAVLSPDGGRLLWASKDGVYVTDDGGDSLTLYETLEPMWPAWSPDGTQVGFTYVAGDASSYATHVVTMASTGGQVEDHFQLEGCCIGGGYTSGPTWSPDGTALAMHGNLLGLLIIDLTTDASMTLTDLRAVESQTATSYALPAWRPPAPSP